jgi:hypothetical protein
MNHALLQALEHPLVALHHPLTLNSTSQFSERWVFARAGRLLSFYASPEFRLHSHPFHTLPVPSHLSTIGRGVLLIVRDRSGTDNGGNNLLLGTNERLTRYHDRVSLTGYH